MVPNDGESAQAVCGDFWDKLIFIFPVLPGQGRQSSKTKMPA